MTLSKSAPTQQIATLTAQDLQHCDPLALAQALAAQLAIAPQDWHRLNRNRTVRAQEQTAAALVYLLKAEPEEALARLQQSVGWLDRSISAPPCPTHGDKQKPSTSNKPTDSEPSA
ncbi:MAG: DUF6439 family protein [Cyanobacteria bacterium J06639_16]